MRLPFKGNFPLTQGFGGNAAAYAKYGLKGHNGLDHAVPTGTPLYAMTTGTVIEALNDPTGYGLYVKIENDKEGALVGHMKSFSVKAGDKVVEGETFIGYSGNSGNSTGPHTHTGYYPKPRDRNNGYNGYIDFSNLLKGNMSQVNVDAETFERMRRKCDQWDSICETQGLGDPTTANASNLASTIGGLKSRITVLEKEAGTAQAEVQNRIEQVGRLKKEVLDITQQRDLFDAQLKSKQEELLEFAKAKGDLTAELQVARNTIKTYEQAKENGAVTLTVKDIFKLIWNQKITISK